MRSSTSQDFELTWTITPFNIDHYCESLLLSSDKNYLLLTRIIIGKSYLLLLTRIIYYCCISCFTLCCHNYGCPIIIGTPTIVRSSILGADKNFICCHLCNNPLSSWILHQMEVCEYVWRLILELNHEQLIVQPYFNLLFLFHCH